jgi:hypothetical protein
MLYNKDMGGEKMLLNNLPSRSKKKQYSTKLRLETIEQLYKISETKKISKAMLIEHLVEMAYQELKIEDQKNK